MNHGKQDAVAQETGGRRLSKAQRKLQLLENARLIVREEGADRLTLGHLAICAGVSKPVVYDHFPSRSALLIELYRWMDLEQIRLFQDAMAVGEHSADEAVDMLAIAYIRCAADMNGEVHAVGAALAGSEEKALVFQELLENCVQMFVAVLKPHSRLPAEQLQRCCVGLVAAGEALAAAVVRGSVDEPQACEAFASLIGGALGKTVQ
ncbi:TetR/AcrR family transcriptional regulator [Pseudomonas sp. v388]|uniref:TetR/AcrR family transcriptional regulator n=1 Tax=Pseudomonas sp. v388 TaxID=2479849 RepID=UPI000F7B8E82|nr:TetR/AcrR family transcriptional regulator [Pseudomonas sp. v388]RRV07556.1 TetR/AcrR family transcriptional regulator [Pseudomonas sp. v388]